MFQAPILGSATLEEQRRTCATTENLEFCKLVHMRKLPVANGKHRNMCIFDDVDPADDQPPPLVFVPVLAGANAASLIATQLSQGKHLIFDERIWVQDSETEVLGFR